MTDWHNPNENRPDSSDAPYTPRGYEYEYPRTPAPRPQPPYARTPPPRTPNAAPERAASIGAEYNPPAYVPAKSSTRRVWLTRLVMFALGSLLVLVCGGLALAGGVYAFYANELPSADKLATVNTSQSTKIYDRNGGLLYEVLDPNLGRHTIIPPEKIPTLLKQATLATEDPTFYTNPGVDWYGVVRAIYYLVRYQRPISGASTITQQLIKNTLLSPEQTVERKIKEAILAVEVTRRYSKDQILAFYLNTINYGNHSYGIQAAAQSYFSKDVSQLDLAEASMLAGLPQLPAIYDPCINPDQALERQKTVLSLMQEQGYINQAQADAAAQEMQTRVASDAFINNCRAGLNYTRAPHFVEYVRQQLQETYGSNADSAGWQVYTTLDPQVQSIIEDEARKQIAALKNKNVRSAAAVAVNPKTGEILGMLGSVDFNDASIDGQVNVATRLRQPGSSIKPITYVAAFEKGWTPATPIYDLVTPFPNGAQPPYVPTNYDNKEHGLVTVRAALANSYNIPAVKTLYFVGVPDMLSMAQRFGITTFTNPNRYGLALTLGGGEVKLTELTDAYAAFANEGKRVPLTPFLKIVDGSGRTIYDATRDDTPPQQVVDPRYAYLIESILSDNAARTPSFGANSPLKTSRPTFVKTGTTNDYKDNWTLGGTNEFVLGVWVGNPRNEAMKNVSGITGAAPIWHNVVERVYQEADAFKNIAPHPLAVPAGLVQAEVCNESGLVPTENCPADHRHNEIFLNNQAPQQFDDVWTKIKIDTTNGLLANENCPPEIVEERVFANLHQDFVLPYDRIRAWGAANGYPIAPTDSSPCTNTTQATPEPVEVKINRPNQGDQVSGTVSVNGSVRIPSGGAWVLEVGRAGKWDTIASGNTAARGKLGQFEANAYGDGELDIRLTATDQWGQPREDKVRVLVHIVVPPTPTPEPTRHPRRTPTLEPTDAPTLEPTLEPTWEPTLEPTQEPTLTPTFTPTPEPTNEPTLPIVITEIPAPKKSPTPE
jgi:penicillin-binding protein 1C